VNSVSKSLNANLSKSLSPNLSARAGLFYTNSRDRNNAATGMNTTLQYNGGLDYRFKRAELSGSVSPGFTARRLLQQPNPGRWDFTPTLNSSLSYGHHQFSLALSKLDQSSTIANGGVDTMTAGFNYRFTRPVYTLGVDANWYDRQPDNVGTVWTNAWRFGAYVTINFDKPVRRVAMARPQTVTDAAPAASAIERMLFDIAALKPGMKVEQAMRQLADAGLGKPSDEAGILIWYSQLLRDIDEQQRLAIETGDGRIIRSALIIDPYAQNDVAAIRALFERLRRELMMAYGQPDSFFETGDFTPQLASELASGRFIRVMEWQRDGGVLRFGIPRRLDGQIRMELQFAPGFASLKETLWSMEQVQ
jgi:hypothetical protein